MNQLEKAERFEALHEGEAFVIPNPWDAGSARVLAGLGFEALATTSGGFAFTLGREDGEVSLDELAQHVEALVGVTDLPISVDLENGFGPAPEDAARAIEAAAAAGAVGGSIEDFGAEDGIYEAAQAVERVSAAVAAAKTLDFPFTLTARAENHLRGNPDLEDTIARLLAFQEAGADVLYAPGLDAGQVRAVCEAVERPVNALGHAGLSLAELVEAGAQRISIGSSLSWVAADSMAAAARRLKEDGDLSGLAIGGEASRLLRSG
ncbi:MAG TPA: isocitrate lyase/phosphoenolpyruvate mutase family protein [Solirubrobacterales bacterium]